MGSPDASSRGWREAFGDETRPTLYSSANSKTESFAELISPSMFLRDTESLSQSQLFASAENCQMALKMAQDEYLHLEHLIRRLDDKHILGNPQNLLDSDRFEEEKEAALYGYKRIIRGPPYTRAKSGADFYGFQEPFSQGGFVPTEAQYKRKRTKAQDANNIDGWTPIERNGKMLIPRMPRSPPVQQRGFTTKTTSPSRTQRLSERNNPSDTDATAAANAVSDSDAMATPSRRGTRFLGRKIPPTRDTSEAPLSVRGSPAPRRLQRPTRAKLRLAPASRLTPIPRSANGTPMPHKPLPGPSNNKRRRFAKNSHKRSGPVSAPPTSPAITATNGNDNSDTPQHHSDDDKKWTDMSLMSAVIDDHSFLHPDPEIALHWKTALMIAPHPVRSWAMKRKWDWWRKGGMDKRPRRGPGRGGGWNDMGEEEEEEEGSVAPRSEDGVGKGDDVKEDDDRHGKEEDYYERKDYERTVPMKRKAFRESKADENDDEQKTEPDPVKSLPEGYISLEDMKLSIDAMVDRIPPPSNRRGPHQHSKDDDRHGKEEDYYERKDSDKRIPMKRKACRESKADENDDEQKTEPDPVESIPEGSISLEDMKLSIDAMIDRIFHPSSAQSGPYQHSTSTTRSSHNNNNNNNNNNNDDDDDDDNDNDLTPMSKQAQANPPHHPQQKDQQFTFRLDQP